MLVNLIVNSASYCLCRQTDSFILKKFMGKYDPNVQKGFIMMTTVTMNNTNNYTIVMTKEQILDLLDRTPYFQLRNKNGKQCKDIPEEIQFRDGIYTLRMSEQIESVDGEYVLVNLIRSTTIAAATIGEVKDRYRVFSSNKVGNTIVDYAKPLGIAMQKAKMSPNDIITINMSDIFAKAANSRNQDIAWKNASMIAAAIEMYGVRIYNDKVYCALRGWVKNTIVVEIYDIDNVQLTASKEIRSGLWHYSKVYMPSGRTSSMKNAGIQFFVANEYKETFERALCAGISLNDRYNQLSNNGFEMVSMKQLFKEWKYLFSSCAGKTVLDLSKCRIAVIDEKGRVGDGNGSADPELLGVPNRTALQSRLRVYQGKGMLLCEKYTFKYDLKYLKRIEKKHVKKVTYYGDSSLPVGVIVDRNFIKMLDEKLEILPEEERSSWIVHEFGEPTKSNMSIDECAKWIRRCANAEDAKVIQDRFIKAFEEAINKMVDTCFTSDQQDNYLPSLLGGIDKWATAKSLDKLFVELESWNKKPSAFVGGYNLGITQHPIFNQHAEGYRKKYGNDGRAIAFVNNETYKLLKNPIEAVLTKFPSPSEKGGVIVHIAIDNRVCNGCIAFNMSEESNNTLEACAGADCDGDKTNIMTTEQYVCDKDGNKKTRLTWLGKVLRKAGYEHLCIKNVLPEIDGSKAVGSITEMHVKDMSSQAGMTGIMVKAMNTVKLGAICLSGGNDCEMYKPTLVAIDGEAARECQKLTIEAIKTWMNRIGHIDSGTFVMNVRLDETNVREWQIEIGIIEDYIAELATGLSGSGVNMPTAIRNYFCTFKNSIIDRYCEQEGVAKDDKSYMQKRNVIERRIAICNGNLFNAVDNIIKQAKENAKQRMSGIDWYVNNADIVETGFERPTDAFGYAGKYMPSNYSHVGFGNIACASYQQKNDDIWAHWNGTFKYAMEHARAGVEERLKNIRNTVWGCTYNNPDGTKYSSMFLPARYLKSLGFIVPDEVIDSYEEKYTGKVAIPVYIYKNNPQYEKYQEIADKICAGKINTVRVSKYNTTNGKTDYALCEVDENGVKSKIGLNCATSSDLCYALNGKTINVTQCIKVRENVSNAIRAYYIVLGTL